MRTLSWLGASPSVGELAVVFLVFLLLFGARKLPELARGLGRALSEFRRAARDVQDEFLRADLEEPPRPPAAGAGPAGRKTGPGEPEPGAGAPHGSE